MALEEEINELSWAEAAKGMAQYLHVTELEPPKGWKGISLFKAIGRHITLPKSERKMIESMARDIERENRKTFSDAGLETQQEKDAWFVAQFTGLAFGRYARYAGGSLRLPGHMFEKVLDDSIADGIACLEERYWVSIPGVKKPEIVNADFKDKAKEWLLKEIYARTSEDARLRLLEKVYIKRDNNGYVCLEGLLFPF